MRKLVIALAVSVLSSTGLVGLAPPAHAVICAKSISAACDTVFPVYCQATHKDPCNP